MKKQIIVTSAILTGLVLGFTGSVWAERERPGRDRATKHYRDRGHNPPDRAVKPDRGRHWRGRGGHRNATGPRLPALRSDVRQHDAAPLAPPQPPYPAAASLAAPS